MLISQKSLLEGDIARSIFRCAQFGLKFCNWFVFRNCSRRYKKKNDFFSSAFFAKITKGECLLQEIALVRTSLFKQTTKKNLHPKIVEQLLFWALNTASLPSVGCWSIYSSCVDGVSNSWESLCLCEREWLQDAGIISFIKNHHSLIERKGKKRLFAQWSKACKAWHSFCALSVCSGLQNKKISEVLYDLFLF